jgi:predicted ATPase/DNA-binding XRE family transcriptional regulator
MMNASVSFGQWLKQRRKALDLTREALAQRIGCAVVTLNKIEADERRPSHQLAELLAEHLNIPLDERPAFISFARAKTGKDGALENPLFYSPTNLPAQPNLLIGRTADVAALRKQLLQPQTRLLTLTGPPGIGKTRLALQLAAEVREDFPDGVFLVSLAPVTDATLVLTTCASTLGVPEGGPQTPLERLKTFLREKQILLVLDNFEQVLAAAAHMADLLAACPWLKLLVTSRAPLRIRPERQFPVSPLTLPNLAQLPDADTVSQYSAVALFLERAQAVMPEFVLTEANAATVVAICARLDGLPLAIELISARIKLLHPAQLLERLSGGLMLRSDGPRDLEPRHRTLNAAIEWSYQLLDLEEQTLFRRLGVFVGGWTLKAVETICMQNLSLDPVDGLASLLDKNLIRREAQSDGGPRFAMLETIREYALQQFGLSGEAELISKQYVAYYAALAEAHNLEFGGLQPKLTWDLQEAEHANFRSALMWCQNAGDNETLLRLASSLRDFWSRRGHMREASVWLADALARSRDVVHTKLSVHAYQRLRATALEELGLIDQWLGDLDAAQSHTDESVALWRELGDQPALAEAISVYGMVFVLRADVERARPLLEESLALFRTLNNLSGISLTIYFLGTLAYLQGETQQADQLWEESTISTSAAGDVWQLASILAQHAMVALDQQDYELARARLVKSLTSFREMGESWQVIHALEVTASLAALQAQQSMDSESRLLRSARIFGAAERLRDISGALVLSFQRRSYERGVATLRAQLDQALLAESWAEGRSMTLNEAVAYALSGIDTASEAEAPSA